MGKKWLMFVALVAALLASCVPSDAKTVNKNISTWHDDENNVTCWIYNGRVGGSSGLSCLPDSVIEKHE